MDPIIARLLDSTRLGAAVTDEGLTVIPVFGESPGVPPLVTLAEALAAGTLTVTEISQAGSVPSLKAHNSGATGVLIVDGEELAGAKQNRVLNTSVYIEPGQAIVIPVSCTEHGRWSYQSTEFGDSGHISVPALRLVASDSVTRSIRLGAGFHSDQGRVWDEVRELQARHRTSSPTSAARDVYEAKREILRRREAVFARVPGQTGVLALWNGKVVGFDAIGASAAYAGLHDRFVRSYSLDAPVGGRASADRDLSTARGWLAALAGAQVTAHESPGAGLAYRFTGAGLLGSALTVDGAILHAVAFATDATVGAGDGEERYPGYVERRDRFPW